MANTQISLPEDFSLENVITTAIQIPGVKVNRKKFLAECFAGEDVNINDIVEFGPIEANCSQEQLARLANKLILNRTSQSSIASFVSGIPGGLAMAATIPADILQFFGMSLRMAQELSYLYGAPDLWLNGAIDNERVSGQLIMYCGVMFGVSGAVAGVRFLSSQIAKQTLKKLPQKALTKTVWYPIVKQVAKAVGIKVTKSTVAKGISKAVPIIGGVVSGGINFASMLPMGKRLAKAFDEANFNYTEEDAEADYNVVAEVGENGDIVDLESEKENFFETAKKKVENVNLKEVGNSVSGALGKFKKMAVKSKKEEAPEEDVFAKLEKLSKLKDMGAITAEEYEEKKAELLSKI